MHREGKPLCGWEAISADFQSGPCGKMETIPLQGQRHRMFGQKDNELWPSLSPGSQKKQEQRRIGK